MAEGERLPPVARDWTQIDRLLFRLADTNSMDGVTQDNAMDLAVRAYFHGLSPLGDRLKRIAERTT